MLDLLLAADFEGVEALREQARGVVAVGRCWCGCPSIDLRAPVDAPTASWSSGRAPCMGELNQIGDERPAQITLLVQAGRLSYLEYVWYGDAPPQSWPPIERLDVSITA